MYRHLLHVPAVHPASSLKPTSQPLRARACSVKCAYFTVWSSNSRSSGPAGPYEISALDINPPCGYYRIMKTKKNPASEAAKLLRAIPSKRRSEQSRINGRKGGRKPSGACSERELRRRVHAYCKSTGRPLSSTASFALTLRRRIVRDHVPFSDMLLFYPTGEAHDLLLLVPLSPILL